VVPHVPARALNESVRPWNQESPTDWYCEMFPNAGSGRPRFATPSAAASDALSVGTLI
jgi:hypothetical protein